MLKPYIVYDEVSINGGKWRKLYSGGTAYTMIDESDAGVKLIIDNASFIEFFNILESGYSNYGNNIYGTVHYLTTFKKRPVIGLSFGWEWSDTERYKTFENISVRTIYKEVQLTLMEIMKKFNSELVIQYLKERGLTTCPLITGG